MSTREERIESIRSDMIRAEFSRAMTNAGTILDRAGTDRLLEDPTIGNRIVVEGTSVLGAAVLVSHLKAKFPELFKAAAVAGSGGAATGGAASRLLADLAKNRIKREPVPYNKVNSQFGLDKQNGFRNTVKRYKNGII